MYVWNKVNPISNESRERCFIMKITVFLEETDVNNQTWMQRSQILLNYI